MDESCLMSEDVTGDGERDETVADMNSRCSSQSTPDDTYSAEPSFHQSRADEMSLLKSMFGGVSPRDILRRLRPSIADIPDHVQDEQLWKAIFDMVSAPVQRQKLRHVNLLSDVVRLLRGASNIIVLTGAGVSVSCGIPDFRSKDGIYARIAQEHPDISDPADMFSISYFRQNPRPFYNFAKEFYPGKFKPSLCHRFISMLEKHNKLLRNYTQNFDTLEQLADITRVIQCHGSFATATCQRCGHTVNHETIKSDILADIIPLCVRCTQSPTSHAAEMTDHTHPASHIHADVSCIMKPDIVFFGEDLPDEFYRTIGRDLSACDLLIVIGSSLKVRPVSNIPGDIAASVPQVLINREPLNHASSFDVELFGDCDRIVSHLCHMLGGDYSDKLLDCDQTVLSEIRHLPRFVDTPLDVASTAGLPLCHSMSSRQPSSPAVSAADPVSVTSCDPVSENDIESLRECWVPRQMVCLADRLPANTFLFRPPSSYVFPGALLYLDVDDMDDDDSSSSSSSTSSSVNSSHSS